MQSHGGLIRCPLLFCFSLFKYLIIIRIDCGRWHFASQPRAVSRFVPQCRVYASETHSIKSVISSLLAHMRIVICALECRHFDSPKCNYIFAETKSNTTGDKEQKNSLRMLYLVFFSQQYVGICRIDAYIICMLQTRTVAIDTIRTVKEGRKNAGSCNCRSYKFNSELYFIYVCIDARAASVVYSPSVIPTRVKTRKRDRKNAPQMHFFCSKFCHNTNDYDNPLCQLVLDSLQREKKKTAKIHT